MQIPKELTTVTKISKTVALIMFISLPIIAFLFGMRYQTLVEQANSVPPTPVAISPTARPKLISPTMTPKDAAFCGGIAGKICPGGSFCKYDGKYPDAGGTCIKENVQTKYTCPKKEYIDCMPGPDKIKKTECTSEFLQWAQANCSNFKGAAL